MKKKYKIDKVLIIPFVLLAVLISAIAFYLHMSTNFENKRKEMLEKVKKLELIYRKTDEIPSIKQISLIRKNKKELSGLMKKYKYTYNKMVTHEDPYERLAFKLKLKELSDNYAKYKIPIPEGIGFKEYLGSSLPDSSKMKELSRQLFFIMQIIEVLIENNVEAILKIQREDVEDINDSSGKKAFNAYHFVLSLKMSYNNILNVLDTFATVNNVIKIKALDLKSNYQEGDFSLDSQLVDCSIGLVIIESYVD